jgi:nitrile hydratase beta subunit
MNGAHDLGGFHGFGAISAEPEADEPVFHAEWEKRVFGLVLAAGSLGKWNIDMARHARERQHPVAYLQHSYYENWLAGLERLVLESGLVTREELASGKADGLADSEDRRRVLKPEDVAAVLLRGSPATAPALTPPRFRASDQVLAGNRHPVGHTRQPRYVRGRVGVIHEHHGAHIFPDQSAADAGQCASTPLQLGRHLYSVRFTGNEVWGESANGNSAVYVDLWEDYLEPV